MNRTAIILAGGFSSRLGQDKSILELNGKPLIKCVIDAVKKTVDEIIIVTNSQERIDNYSKLLDKNIQFLIDIEQAKGPLVGTLTGLEKANGDFSLILPSDMPFVSSEVIDLLFNLCLDRSAVIPRWPNQDIEPLHAVYRTKTALNAAKKAVDQGQQKMTAMLDNIQSIRYVSTLVIEQINPDLKTFFNINTPIDLKKAEFLLKPKPTKKTKRQYDN
ncbi:MAG: molybdenum cofactor guanylyltransferase [Crenarchaeota archaeon]|nr:molybdenum cofactor guanylyltransferase [Thermoproteota archaeon]